MTDWEAIARAMHIPLLSAPCRCQFDKTWKRDPQLGQLYRPRTLHCSRCRALAIFEAAHESTETSPDISALVDTGFTPQSMVPQGSPLQKDMP